MLLSLISAATALAALGAPAALPEIVVTARKREESILEVPVAVTAFSAESIRELGIRDLQDIARFTPGFALNTPVGRQPASFKPVFRGLTTVRNGVMNANAGNTFIDGVYVGSALLTTELADIERVEIMRGPQSAQYGRNTYAGAINYVTRKPSHELEGEVTAAAGSDERYETSGRLSGPLFGSQRLRFALGAAHSEYGGEWHNLRDGSDIGGEESDELSAKLLFAPTDDLDITLRLGWQGVDDDHFAMYLQPSTLDNCCFRNADAPRARGYYIGKAQPHDEVNLYTDLLERNGGSGTQLDRLLGSLAVNWQIGGLTLTSLTGFIRDEYETGIDTSYAGYAQPAAAVIFEERDYDDFSQELRLTSSADQPLRFTVGAYFYDGSAKTPQRLSISPTTGAASPMRRSHDNVENRALFGAVAWDFATHWNAGVELRWSEDEVRVTSVPVTGSATSYDADPESLTPRFTLSWQPVASTTGYINVSRGTKAPDFNTDVTDERYRKVDEESAWNYELGMKGVYFERRLSLALAAYHIDVRDQQLTELIELPTGTASILTNAQSSSIWGFEAEAGWQINEHLTLQATYAYTDSEFDEWVSQEQADLRGSNGTDAENQLLGSVADMESPRVPEHMASLVLRYERPLSATMDWYGSLDYSYESSKYAAEHNLIETGDRNLVGLRTGLTVGHWDFGLWVRNLFDDDTPLDIFRYFDSRAGLMPSCTSVAPPGSDCSSTSRIPRGFAIPLPPGRQMGMTLNYRF